MKRIFSDYIRDILEECLYLMRRAKNLKLEDFLQDEDFKRASIRSLEIIGEASKKIPKEVREKYSSIPWKEMAGMRDKLIHEYFGVNYFVVYETIKRDIPELKSKIENVLKELEK